jgi:hypothetical protein
MKSLKEIVMQLRSCGFTCEAGPLENNVDFQLLEEIAGCKEKTVAEALIEAGNIIRKNFERNPFIPSFLLTRDEITEKAKRDVSLNTTPGPFAKGYSVRFIVNREKRTIVALQYYNEALKKRGIAKCNPSDCFNVHIGKAIALRRALGLEVPAEYLNAPQPTEVRVGDVIGFPYDIHDRTRDEVITVNGQKIRCACGDFYYLSELFTEDDGEPSYYPRIIDDSREEVAE